MYVSKLTIIGSDNGLSPGRRQAITLTNDGILLIGPLGTNFSEIISKIHSFSFKKMHLKTSSAKWRPFCLGLNVFIHNNIVIHPLEGFLAYITPHIILQNPDCDVLPYNSQQQTEAGRLRLRLPCTAWLDNQELLEII